MSHIVRLPFQVILLALATYLCFSTFDALCRLVILHGHAQTQVLAIAHVFAFLPVLAYVHLRRQWGELLPRFPWWVTLRAMVAVFEVGCVFFTLTHLKMAQSYTLFLTLPLWTALLGAVLLGERLRLVQILGVLVGFGGVLIAMQPSVEGFSLAQITGLGVGFFGSLSVVIMRKIGRKESAGTILLTLFLFLAAMNAAMVEAWRPVDMDSEFAFLILAGLALGLGHVCFYTAIRYAPAPMFAPFQYSQILWMLLYGMFLFDEVAAWHTLAGLGLVSLGGWFIVGRMPASFGRVAKKDGDSSVKPPSQKNEPPL